MKEHEYQRQEMSAYYHWGWKQTEFTYVDSYRLKELIRNNWNLDLTLNNTQNAHFTFIGGLHKLTDIEERRLHEFISSYLQEYELINNPNHTVSLKPVSKVIKGKIFKLFLNALYTKNLLPKQVRIHG